MIGYGFTKELDLSYETVKEVVVEELKKEGFGVLREIDVQVKLKEKLGIDFNFSIIHFPDLCPDEHRSRWWHDG